MTREDIQKAELNMLANGIVGTAKYIHMEILYNHAIDSLEQRNAELEQRVKELEEPKSCEGCEYDEFNNDADKLIICLKCTRLWVDNYKPKDTK